MAAQVIAPGDPMANFWTTRPDCRTVVGVIAQPTAGFRLLDTLPLLEADYRVQLMLTVPETDYRWAGLDRLVESFGWLVVPWQQVLDTPPDLALAACYWGLSDLRAPIVMLPHGAGAVRSRIGPWGGAVAHDLHAGHLGRNGEVVPSAIVLAQEGELEPLARAYPPALSRAVVAGDPCFDRMLAGRPYRELYRAALGVRPGQKLVVASTTWSRHSLFGTDPRIFSRLASELPADEYRVVSVLHPFVWFAHGRQQVLSWLAEARAAGVLVLPPEEGWRAAVVGADVVVGDHGSVSQYAAGLGVPVLMNVRSLVDVWPHSTADILAGMAAPLHLDRPLAPQVRSADTGVDPLRYAEVAALITSRPGRSGAILRQLLYQRLGLPEPAHNAPVSPAPLPVPIR